MSANSVTIKSGDTIWGLVAARNPGASNAEIQKKTQAVLDANGLTWDTAKKMHAGDTVNLDAAGGNGAANTTPTPANTAQGANTGGGDLLSLIQQFIKMQGQTNPFGTGTGLDAFLNGTGGGLSGNALASRSGAFTFGLAGGDVLPFANPSIILGNLGLTA